MPAELGADAGAAWNIVPIARIHSCFAEKFGIPRQPGLVTKSVGTLEMLPPYDRPEMFVGLDRYSHIWIHFLFHGTISEGWRSTVRPPGLGGQKRVGVFASRSPHRPNFLGMSVVRLVAIRNCGKKIFLDLEGIDVLDQTPVFDIKPYLPYSDSIADAAGSAFTTEMREPVEVGFSDQAKVFIQSYQSESGRDLLGLIWQILRQDPRPPSQKGDGREFGMMLWDVNIRWQVQGGGFFVLSCERIKAG
ncbi:MAG: tRNA (N6-threonylcarbamoyladenosine(37)-N6)-methyltransferase TrmO [Desulfobulbaceae bacterium]|nr:MAG: tRNA (N6-threonylcarbamoyladenosine(37)-N6)-methyltransferase TrmO [Desulfobulbaceae bacterium]